ARHQKGGEEAEPLAEWERELLEGGAAAETPAEETSAEKDA
ncbi:MAG: hypothetical protein RLZ65_232, partial [Actinomycetota bacterium]